MSFQWGQREKPEGIDLVRRKAHTKLRLRGFGMAEELGCMLVFWVITLTIVGFGTMALNRLPLDTPEWERYLIFWIVGLSPVIGGFTAFMISLAVHDRRETFRHGNRVEIIRGPHEGCLGIVCGTRYGFKPGNLVKNTHVSVTFEENGEVLTDEFYISELVKVDFRSRWF